MKTINYVLCIFFIAQCDCVAQSLDQLTRYRTSDVYHSGGYEARAAKIETYVSKAMSYYAARLGFRPKVTVLVLNELDWSRFTDMPVYGMPHYNDDRTLIVAATDNPMWESFLPDPDQLPDGLAAKVKETYKGKGGTVTMEGFFDLLVVHELGHAFHLQGGLNVQRTWMGEFFCNLFLHTYVAEVAPDKLGALTVFPEMVVRTGDHDLVFKTLREFDENYSTLGTKYPANYGWYQCRLHLAAKNVYDTAGKDALPRLWNALRSQQTIADDGEFADLLRRTVHQSVSDVILKW